MQMLAVCLLVLFLTAPVSADTVQIMISGSRQTEDEVPQTFTIDASFTAAQPPSPAGSIPLGFIIGPVNGNVNVNGTNFAFSNWEAAFADPDILGSGGEGGGNGSDFNFALSQTAGGTTGVFAQTPLLFDGTPAAPVFRIGSFQSELTFAILDPETEVPVYIGPATFTIRLLDDNGNGNGNGGAIPEPATLSLLGSALAGLVLLRRRRG